MDGIVMHHSGWRAARGGVLVVLFAGLLLAVGCATVGRKFDSTRVHDIRNDQTTQSEIRSMFGSPWRVGMEDGMNTWTYGRYKYRLFGQASTTDLVVRFDRNGLVKSYTFNTTEHFE